MEIDLTTSLVNVRPFTQALLYLDGPGLPGDKRFLARKMRHDLRDLRRKMKWFENELNKRFPKKLKKITPP